MQISLYNVIIRLHISCHNNILCHALVATVITHMFSRLMQEKDHHLNITQCMTTELMSQDHYSLFCWTSFSVGNITSNDQKQGHDTSGQMNEKSM